MQPSASVLALVEALTARFPEDAAQAAARIDELGYDPDAWFTWFEQFSQITTEAMRRGDEATARAHLDFISERLWTADADLWEFIDVAYVEHLMWNLNDKAKKRGWTLVPNNLRELYVAMWGAPSWE